MTNSENKALKKEVRDIDTYEDEIDLMDYFLVLWKRKRFIFLASILSALIVGLVMFFSPRDYTLTFTYNWKLGENDLRILEDVFYSEENISKLMGKLQTAGFEDYAGKLAKGRSSKGLKSIIAFEISPTFLTKPENAKSFEEAQRFQQAKGSLLLVCITLDSKKDIHDVGLIFRENIEEVMPLYSEKEYLNQNVMGLKSKMAAIDEARYTLNLQLERKKATLKKLNELSSGGLDKLPGDNIVLQFNGIRDSNTYLPLSYQRQAAETQIINAEEQARANNEMYDYYVGLLKLSERLFGCVNKAISSDGTLRQYCSSLVGMLAEYKDNAQITDYLNAYVKGVENKLTNNMPITEKPKIYSLAKGTVKKTGVVFVIAFTIAVFAAFLCESLEKRKAQLL